MTVDASSANTAFTADFGAALPSPHLLRLRLTDQTGTVVSENMYWRYRNPADLQALNQLPQASASLRTQDLAAREGRNRLVATLRNDSGTVAAMVVLSLRDRRSGRRLLPTLYSHNYLWLLPGDRREVTVSWRSAGRQEQPQLVVDGYNLPHPRH